MTFWQLEKWLQAIRFDSNDKQPKSRNTFIITVKMAEAPQAALRMPSHLVL